MHRARTLSIAEPGQTMTVDGPLQISQMGWRGRDLGICIAERLLQRRLLTRTQQQGHPVVTGVQDISAVLAVIATACDVPANLSQPTNVPPKRRQTRLGVARVARHPRQPSSGHTRIAAVREREQDPDQPFHRRGLVSACCFRHDSPHHTAADRADPGVGGDVCSSV